MINTAAFVAAGEAIKKSLDAATSFLDEALQYEMTLDEIVSIYTPAVDKIIWDEVNRGNQYVGGTFHIKYVKDDSFMMLYEMYFQTPDKKWLKKYKESNPQNKKHLKEEEFIHLKQKGAVEYEIDMPEKKTEAATNV